MPPPDFGHAAEAKLSWKHFPAGPNGFFRAPVLVSGPTEALLIDGGFSYPDGRALAEAIKATGKKLTTIYVSQSDPDYYFSLKPLRDAFPNAKVIAASATVEAIKGSVEKKLAVWGPKLKENGPQTLADVVLPEAFDGASLTVDGETIEIVAAEGLANRRYLWVPSLNAVFGGVMIFSGVHVWTADTPTEEQRAAWIANLDKIAARKPAVVVAGHTTPKRRPIFRASSTPGPISSPSRKNWPRPRTAPRSRRRWKPASPISAWASRSTSAPRLPPAK